MGISRVFVRSSRSATPHIRRAQQLSGHFLYVGSRLSLSLPPAVASQLPPCDLLRALWPAAREDLHLLLSAHAGRTKRTTRDALKGRSRVIALRSCCYHPGDPS